DTLAVAGEQGRLRPHAKDTVEDGPEAVGGTQVARVNTFQRRIEARLQLGGDHRRSLALYRFRLESLGRSVVLGRAVDADQGQRTAEECQEQEAFHRRRSLRNSKR